jgi:C4-dicarboxylate transporter, DctM subunit
MMIWWVALIVLVVLIVVTMVSGLWTAVALGVPGIIVIFLSRGTIGLEGLGSVLWTNTGSFVLTAVPLFLLMGQFIVISGVGAGFFRGLDTWTRWLRGGLASGTILTAAVLHAAIGSSVATAAAVGGPALPEMRRRGYHPGFAGAAVAAGGSLGILLPPSIPLIIYGSFASVSVSKLFLGALLPGCILAAAFLIYTLINAAVRPKIAGERLPGTELKEKLKALPAMVPVIVLIVMVVTLIQAGVATPTEAAALGAGGAMLIAWRKLSWKVLWATFKGAVFRTVMIFGVIVAAQIISYALVASGVSRAISQAVVDMGLNEWGFLAFVVILKLLLGQIIDGVSMMLLTFPVLFPIVLALGFNPIVFGVIMCVLIELGQIMPPIGINLFMVHGIDRTVPIRTIAKWAIPYDVMMLIFVFIIAAFPSLVLWLAGSQTI